MGWYAEQLLRPFIKALVILVFTGLLIACSLSATRMSEDFTSTDVIPEDSYLSDFFAALDDYTTRAAPIRTRCSPVK